MIYSLLKNILFSVFWSSTESRHVNPSQRLLSSLDMQGEGRKKYTTSSLNDLKNSNRQSSSKQHKQTGDYWSLLHLYILSRNRAFLFELGFGLTIQRMTTYSRRKGLAKTSAVSFTVRRELNSFVVISCSMEWTKHVIPVSRNCPPPIGLELVLMDFALDKNYLRNNQSLTLSLSTPIHLFKWRI